MCLYYLGDRDRESPTTLVERASEYRALYDGLWLDERVRNARSSGSFTQIPRSALFGETGRWGGLRIHSLCVTVLVKHAPQQST